MAIDTTEEVRPGRLANRYQAMRGWLGARTKWEWALAALIAVYTIYFSVRSLYVHHGLGTSAYDYGLYDQGVWLLSRFETPFVTLMGRHLMGDHTSFILFSLVPFYWVLPGAVVLFVSQSLVIGLGALPVFLYTRKRLASEALAFVLAVVFLLHPAVGWTNLENFHPDSFLGFFVGMAIYGALTRKWRLYTVFVILALLVKEDVALILVPLGIWVTFRRSWKIGLATVVGSVSFMLLAMFVVMRGLIGVPTRNTWRIPFGGPTGFFSELFKNPGAVFSHLTSDGRPWYLFQMTSPLAFVFMRLPDVALIGSGVLFTNILSTFWYQYQIEYHYGLVVVPALVIGTAYAIGAVREGWRQRLVVIVAVTSVLGAILWGPLGSTASIFGHYHRNQPIAAAARDIISDIPPDAVVSAYHRITAHTAHRREIYMFPTPFRTTLYGVDNSLERTRLPSADRVEYVVLPVNIDDNLKVVWDGEQDDFELVRENQFWRLYVRTNWP